MMKKPKFLTSAALALSTLASSAYATDPMLTVPENAEYKIARSVDSNVETYMDNAPVPRGREKDTIAHNLSQKKNWGKYLALGAVAASVAADAYLYSDARKKCEDALGDACKEPSLPGKLPGYVYFPVLAGVESLLVIGGSKGGTAGTIVGTAAALAYTALEAKKHRDIGVKYTITF